MRRIKGWFRCEYPGCPVETDYGYIVILKNVQNKKIKVCETCYKNIKYPIHHKDIKRSQS